MEQLECHYNWHPEEDTSKLHLEALIKKTENKISKDPSNKAAYLTTISYLYTFNCVLNLSKADEHLQDALKCENSSEFVIRADMLHLKQIVKGRKLTHHEMEPDLKVLIELWKDASNRARAYGVKGATYSCFGPTKLQIGADAFAQALQLAPDNYLWLYGEAQLLTRLTRLNGRQKPADEYQLQLWENACRIGEQMGLTDAAFYAYYAEAILHNHSLTRLCEQMTNESVWQLKRYTRDKKVNYKFVHTIALKIYQSLQLRQEIIDQNCGGRDGIETIDGQVFIHRRPQYDTRIQCLLRDAETLVGRIDDPGIYLELGKEAKHRNEVENAIRYLEIGQELADKTGGNTWIDLTLASWKAEHWGKDRTVTEFNRLKLKYSECDKDLPTIEFRKALWLIKFGEIDAAMESCLAAVKLEENLSEISKEEKCEFFSILTRNSENREEFLAWFAENVGNFTPHANIEKLFQSALARNPQNVFALEHLGKFYLKNGATVRAVECFRKLPDSHKRRRSLSSVHV